MTTDTGSGPRLIEAFESTFGRRHSSAASVDIMQNGDQIFPVILDAVRTARESIEFATFIYWEGEIAIQMAESLAERASAGVDVRVLIDAWGGRPMADELVDAMTDAGCAIAFYNPLDWRRPWRAGHRSHRKTLIVDRRVGFTGGVGIASEWEGNASCPSEWRDSHFAFTGSVVRDLRATFIDNWIDATGEHPMHLTTTPPFAPPSATESIPTFVVAGDHSDARNDIHAHLRLLLRAAHHKIRITTAYFVPDPAIVDDLIDAAGRGVDVHLLVPGPHTDKNFVRLADRATMQRLDDGAVQVSVYEKTMLHAKVLTIDGAVTSVGSANVNRRSGHHDQEANVVVFDRPTAEVLDDHFDEDLQASVPFADADMADPGPAALATERLVRPFRPWM